MSDFWKVFALSWLLVGAVTFFVVNRKQTRGREVSREDRERWRRDGFSVFVAYLLFGPIFLLVFLIFDRNPKPKLRL